MCCRYSILFSPRTDYRHMAALYNLMGTPPNSATAVARRQNVEFSSPIRTGMAGPSHCARCALTTVGRDVACVARLDCSATTPLAKQPSQTPRLSSPLLISKQRRCGRWSMNHVLPEAPLCLLYNLVRHGTTELVGFSDTTRLENNAHMASLTTWGPHPRDVDD